MEEEIQKIYEELKQSFKSGKTRPIESRKKQLLQIKKMLEEKEDEINEVLEKDLHRSKFENALLETSMTKNEINLQVKKLKKNSKAKQVDTNITLIPSYSYIKPEPYGTILIISPFNYPIFLALVPLIGAIAAGNNVVLKPSELIPNCSAFFKKTLNQYVDKDFVQVVEGSVKETQELLKKKWDYIFFTGSPTVAKIVMKAAANFLTPLTLELGGKSPTIIGPDADLYYTARKVLWGKITNSGQTCISPDYVFIHKDKVVPFIHQLKVALKKFFPDGVEKSKDFTHIINERHTQRLQNLIEKSTEEGCQIVIGGKVNVSEKIVEPTVITKVKPESTIMQEEIFGPILPIMEYENVDEVIEYINSKEKPLVIYLFSNNKTFREKITENTSSGAVAINDVLIYIGNDHLPFGGVGQSGFGSYHGDFSFNTFSHLKPFNVRPNNILTDIPQKYPPYKDSNLKILTTLTSLPLDIWHIKVFFLLIFVYIIYRFSKKFF
ncbi:aldehyde dehydrogenase [Anaeramoeba ignava]|uniref:Aldehyde dehydrogenase n=1 Tax=Anaeramoeba ignava TaxID=1746090 RepID=A0A9Q0LX38_ANAIG|nr:aldehyde dehydrogenase [Anaeramoeba ignava]